MAGDEGQQFQGCAARVFFAAFPLADEAGGDVQVAGEDGLAGAFALAQGADAAVNYRTAKVTEKVDLVLDPVGAGATPYRNAALTDLMKTGAPTIVRGNGKRKLAVFEDPNCGYCKR